MASRGDLIAMSDVGDASEDRMAASWACPGPDGVPADDDGRCRGTDSFCFLRDGAPAGVGGEGEGLAEL
jgi:hypothetical protein